jgi:uncharacterized membrane protein YdjX (TVP38/TMEM64 family)
MSLDQILRDLAAGEGPLTWLLALPLPLLAPTLIAAFVVGTLLLISHGSFAMAAGLLLGPQLGLPVAIIGALLSMLLSMLISRSVLRPMLLARMSSNPTFPFIDNALAKGAVRWNVLLRLAPIIPFGLENLLVPLARIPTITYLASSLLAMLPSLVLYVFAGHALPTTIEQGLEPFAIEPLSSLKFALRAIAFVALFLLIFTFGLAIRQALHAAEHAKLSHKPSSP